MPRSDLQLDFNSQPENYSLARATIRRFALDQRVALAVIDEIELAVDEAVTNVVEHAYARRPDGLICLRAWVEKRKLFVTIRDFGKGYKPRPVGVRDVRRILRGDATRGLGRFLMTRCMDAVCYTSRPGQYNETRMVKKLPR